MDDEIGLLPVPLGPDAENYAFCLFNLYLYCMPSVGMDIEKAAFIMGEISRNLYNDGEYYDYLREDLLQNSGNSYKILTHYLLPNAVINIAGGCDIASHVQYFYLFVYQHTTPPSMTQYYNQDIQKSLDSTLNR